jgi:phosphoribosylamine---glycine ligase
MKVLVIGSGGREHALVWKLIQSPKVEKVYCSPGNAGIAKIAECIKIDQNDFPRLVQFVIEKSIDLTVIGPEIPLANGITDYFLAKDLKIFGPGKAAAEIESSKAFAKNLMKKYNIPTADFEVFKAEEYEGIIEYLKNRQYPLVIKADGLAAGKGVIIPDDYQSAVKCIDEIIKDKSFGSAGNTIVIEEFMQGEEASLFAITDGKDFVILSYAQDHKRIGDGDKGKNTGGMGAYAPAPLITPDLMNKCIEKIVIPTISGMQSEGRPFRGCLYCGLMITTEGPKVVEYNCRFGDPETQAVMPLIESDVFDLLYAAADNKIAEYNLKLSSDSAVCVIMASKGYPDAYEKGKEISGLEKYNDSVSSNVIVFHSGTKEEKNKILTAGGRVLGITAIGKNQNLDNTIQAAYEAVKNITFEGAYFRSDIGKKALR